MSDTFEQPPRSNLVPRNPDQIATPLLDDPPIGHLQAVVLHQIAVLGADAFGYRLHDTLSSATGVAIDRTQIYIAIRKLLAKDLIVLDHVRASTAGGPPTKSYRLTDAGRDALGQTAAHHRALAAFLGNASYNPPKP